MDKHLKPSIFSVEPHSPTASKEWNHWIKTFRNFLQVIEHTNDNDKLNILINYISHGVYELIDESDTFEDAISILESIYLTKKNEVFSRYKLATEKQKPGESILQYVQRLRVMSKDCEFKAVTAHEHRDQYVRDAFISGILSTQIRQRLLENKTLSLDNAIKQAESLEAAESQSEQYSQLMVDRPTTAGLQKERDDCQTNLIESDTPPSSNNTQINAVSKSIQKCYFCGYDRHSRSVCPAKDAECKKCGKTGHYAKVCRSGGQTDVNRTKTKNVASSIVASVSPNPLAKALVESYVDEIPATCLIDTGSSNSYLNLEFVKKNKLKLYPEVGEVSMASTSFYSKLEGFVVVDFKLKKHKYSKFKFSVLKELCADVLVGHDLMRLHSGVDVSFGGDLDQLQICNAAPAQVEPCKLFGNLSPDCRPIATKSRRHSITDTKFIDGEISRMLKEGIITESNSPWRAQVLVTSSENHKRRLVIDYSQTINKYTLLDAYPLPDVDDVVRKVASFKIFSSIDLKDAFHQIPILPEERIFTAFEANGHLYEFTRIPFGVTNGVACFQRALDRIIKQENLTGVVSYLDDLTVCGNTAMEHNENLSKFLTCCQKYGLIINQKKSVFNRESIKLLGHLVSHNTIKPDPERLKPLLNLPAPSNATSLKRVLGFFAYYAKWIPKFSDKIQYLINSKSFPLSKEANQEFQNLKEEISKAMVTTISSDLPLVVETDASDSALAATLSQDNRPVAFFSRTLSKSEKFYSAVEKEAAAIMEALRKWKTFLVGKPFKLITDQQALSFILSKRLSSKIKSDKVVRWRIELAPYDFEIIYRPGMDNIKADMLSRVCGATYNHNTLFELHVALCHPGVTRMIHWVRSKNLPYSVEDVRKMTSQCAVCSEIKPRFFKHEGRLIKATSPMERLNIDFKGPLPSNSRNKYILTVTDEYSRFPFAFPCKDMTSATVNRCLNQLFHLVGLPSYIHSDRGASFLSHEVSSFLNSLGIATSRTTSYNPKGNGQVERYNGIVWKSVSLALRSKNLGISCWETVLEEALHSIRSLLCTSTNCTPHERFFLFPRKSTNGNTMPSWLMSPGPVFVKKNVRSNKYEDLVEEADLLQATPEYAWIRRKDGTEDTVSLRQIAPKGNLVSKADTGSLSSEQPAGTLNLPPFVSEELTAIPEPTTPRHSIQKIPEVSKDSSSDTPTPTNTPRERHPQRIKKMPAYLKDYVL